MRSSLEGLEFGASEAVVRVNSLSSGFTHEDVRVCLSGTKLPPTLMLPKVEQPSDLDTVSKIYLAQWDLATNHPGTTRTDQPSVK